jgi:hypothetical protein
MKTRPGRGRVSGPKADQKRTGPLSSVAGEKNRIALELRWGNRTGSRQEPEVRRGPRHFASRTPRPIKASSLATVRPEESASDDAIRSLVISQRLLVTNEVVVIHHTDCGMLTFRNQQLVDKIREELGADASAIDFLAFADLEESLLADVETLRRSDLIPDDVSIAGAIYEVETGQLHEITRK